MCKQSRACWQRSVFKKIALRFAGKFRRDTDNGDVKLLLSHIMDDERRHHDTLIQISERYVKDT